MPRPMKWWGWGERGPNGRLPEPALARLRSRARRGDAARRPGRARWTLSIEDPRLSAKLHRAAWRRGRRGVGSRRIALRVSATPPARAIQTSSACGPVGRAGARCDRLSERPRIRWRRCCGSAASTASRSCRSAAARAWSAASSRSRGSFDSLIALDLARMTTVTQRRRALADGHARPRPARAAGGGATAAQRASRSATSRSRSSTRPSAAGSRPARPARPRPATARSRRWSSGLRCVTPDGGDRVARRCPRARPGRSCASCWSARRACSG